MTPTISMDAVEADEKAASIEEIPEAQRTPDDWALLTGYKALAKGKELIDVGQAIVGAGLNAEGLPRLAIARADMQWAKVRCNSEETTFNAGPRQASRGRWPKSLIVKMPLIPGKWTHRTWDYQAMVPPIPAEHRPVRFNLSRLHILWEAVWKRQAPHDPMLLRQIEGTLFVVLSHWNLTPLEQAVMNARLNA